MSTWLITGCSTGLGRALAEAVIAAGHNAVITARDVGMVSDLAADNTDRVLALPLDVTETAQVTKTVSQAEEKFGGIDASSTTPGTAIARPSRKGTTPTSVLCSRRSSSVRSQ
jgi:NAD(P)-dependent dehydrogenase (short-subunit alcohol dehydrogenase family)